MPIRLQDVLNHPTLRVADPVIRAAAGTAAGTQLRWIHSSEILDIAPLLDGGELLLTGGEALAHVSEERQIMYVRQLAERGVAALAIETGVTLPSLPSAMVSAAEAAGLPLIELRKVVPFVGVMQAINSKLVSESVAQLRRADEASHAMAVELAHGGNLDRILAVLAGIINSEVTLVSLAGATLASASPGVAGEESDDEIAGSVPAGQVHARLIHIDVPVRGIPAAHLVLRVPAHGDENLARTAGKRSVDILALAMLQRMSPGLREVAGAALIRAVDSGSQPWRLQQLASAAGIPASVPLVAMVVRSDTSQQLRTSVEQLLARAAHAHATYVDNAELLAVANLGGGNPDESRQKLIAGLLELPALARTLAAVGPWVAGVSDAPWSLSEAKLTLELAASREQSRSETGGAHHPVVDAEAFAVERLAVQSLDPYQRRNFVRQQLGSLLDHDARRNSRLRETLETWLDCGCNTAQAARELHLERQSMHQRLRRIFELCGGDPRETGRLAALHLATRLAPLV
ncbi:PucR family transcriptional regulator ligand-binding domain-containing protein [Arthrobacter sp. AL12]|uniref:PucR family transcriptional regulator n=1 Tax=Arthrobacter sp. AL12 TaxID=3042241 RepID=UPI00249A3344|nr:PucR family transcriptional regulator ligand-binding domain-containing protein [Arthrobacter sp. AL12]MDI3213738.1 PucR family transcriptional regulator ligand-binding domain-containing protein [Arthrobacter sp. AL12]